MSASEPACTAAEALARLKAGNARFVRGETRFPTVHDGVRAALKQGQQPYATVLACSDSRVPPELVFDAGLGELFVIRVAGNVLGPAIAGTLQYAREHLHTPLFVVMGHENCGAVQAALDARLHGARQKARIEALLDNVLPALDDIDLGAPPEQRMHAAVEANVRRTLRSIRASADAGAAVADGSVQLVGAVYDLDTGRVQFLD
ncbi:MAG: carbonic anhydrase [Burkholderiales bacterium]|nr:carbonic anhydrase [Burkholderiales bacterium]